MMPAVDTALGAQWQAWWPWLAIAALGLFHGINPAMGWLFAVALGLHRGRRRVVLLSLLPIAFGHAIAVALALTAALTVGSALDPTQLARVCGVVLIAWAVWHAVRGHRMRARVGLQAGMAGLALWSFLMASTHGAGLMLIPALMALCSTLPGTSVSSGMHGAMMPALLALGLHTATMLVAIGAIALVVYDRLGVGFLRTGWINLDYVWTIALALCGALLLFA